MKNLMNRMFMSARFVDLSTSKKNTLSNVRHGVAATSRVA